MSFEDLGLDVNILKALSEMGYEKPTPVQQATIPLTLSGRDVLGIAQTGTGKTASFTLPMIDRLAKGRARARMPRSLILEPTRELAAQVAESFEKYGRYHKLSMALLIGGVAFGEQEKKLDQGVDVLIATPGRLLDHFGRGKLLLTGVQILVVDEADRMLDMGFIPDIERIFSLTPFTRQTLFFSATMPAEIQRLVDRFLQGAQRVEVTPPSKPSENIEQFCIKLSSSEPKAKRWALYTLLKKDDIKNGIVFCNRKHDVDSLARALKKHGYHAAPIHGDLAQNLRMETLQSFRSGELQFLIASDVAARGLDIPEVSHVFNYDIPHHPEDYVHRIGRTGRAGHKGKAYTLVTAKDTKALETVETLLGQSIEVIDPGDGEEKHLTPVSGEMDSIAKKNKAKRTQTERKRQSSSGVSRSSYLGKSREAEPAQPDMPVSGFGDHLPGFMMNYVGKNK